MDLLANLACEEREKLFFMRQPLSPVNHVPQKRSVSPSHAKSPAKIPRNSDPLPSPLGPSTTARVLLNPPAPTFPFIPSDTTTPPQSLADTVKKRGRSKGSRNKKKATEAAVETPQSTVSAATSDSHQPQDHENSDRWTNGEVGALLEYMLGEDADDLFSKLQVSSNKIWRKVVDSDVLPGCTHTQIQRKYESLYDIFKKLYRFCNFTSRGADADDYDWDDPCAVDTHLHNSHKLGCDIEGSVWLGSGRVVLEPTRPGTR
ncbi:hypothetical protein EV361DRAFT_980493 [Lentinula raphanica]|nr:hypothetical protein EV361DRAFT_980493 [Lentinula raphanica]